MQSNKTWKGKQQKF